MYDEIVVNAFLENQGQLFDEPVAEGYEQAEDFLEDVCAVVCDNEDELLEILGDEMDISEMSRDELLEIEEVFPLPDGRYLLVEG